MRENPADSRNRFKSRALLVGLLVLEAMIRAPAFTQGGFVSHDVAGILYSAMVFHDGGLPYVDTVELKAPGSFYLAWAFAGPDGRDIAKFQVIANLWAMCGTCLVFTMMTRARGILAGTVAGLVYTLQQPWLDSMDANYVTWANTLQVGAFAAVWRSPEAGASVRARAWLCAGLLAAAAALCRRQASFILIPLVWCAVVMPAGAACLPGLRRRRLVGLVLGGVAPFLAVFVHYASHGEGGAFVRAYGFNEWGWSYISAAGRGGSTLLEGCLATTFFLALPLGLVAPAAAGGLGRARRWGPLVVWLVSMVAAAWIGGRLYKGYFALTLAPAAMLSGAATATLVRSWRRGVRPGRLGRALALAVTMTVGVLSLRSGLLLEEVRAARHLPRDAGARRIASHVAAHTTPEDTIWVWGWHLWDLYPLAGRLAGSSIYKSLGVLTPANDDNWRSGARPLRFMESARSERLLRELRASRPRYIVLGSTVPHREFKALREHLRRAYARDRRVRVGRVEIWRLRDTRPAR